MRHYKIVGCLAMLLLATPALAVVPALVPLNLHARYNVTWGGIRLGHINMDIAETPGGEYHMVIETETSGIVKLFSEERTVGEINGHYQLDGDYIPVHYHSKRTREDTGTTDMRYGINGVLISRARHPEDDPSWRPPVPAEQVGTTTDPMSAGLRLRRFLHDHMAQEIRETTIRSYDGARLGEFYCKVVRPTRVEVMDEYRDAIDTVITRKPIAGYTPKELKKFAKGDPVIHLYFSADKEMLPLQLTIETSFGEVSATLVRRSAS